MSDKVNILLVDDQPARLLSYRSILEDLKQNLVTANSGNEALSKVMKQDFAVILLDVSMPGMDGFETASLIHEHPRYERTPIIFVTGVHITELDRSRATSSAPSITSTYPWCLRSCAARSLCWSSCT
jgi:CheY-like chemotaxis protein